MSDIAAALKELSEPWPLGDKIKAAIARSARAAGLSYWRTFDLWYGKARRVEQHEIEQINEALKRRRKEIARNEIQDLRLRLAQLESLLVLSDEEFHRPSIDALGQSVRRSRRSNRALDEGT